jgi:hypothetical protein
VLKNDSGSKIMMEFAARHKLKSLALAEIQDTWYKNFLGERNKLATTKWDFPPDIRSFLDKAMSLPRNSRHLM